jgi:hypothetical protein
MKEEFMIAMRCEELPNGFMVKESQITGRCFMASLVRDTNSEIGDAIDTLFDYLGIDFEGISREGYDQLIELCADIVDLDRSCNEFDFNRLWELK